MKRDWKAYYQRNSLLKSLGYQCYKDYLASPLWRKIKKAALLPESICIRCRVPAQLLHHVSYSRQVLVGEDISCLVPICHSCHGLIEFDEQGEKRTLEEANNILGLGIATKLKRKPGTFSYCRRCGNVCKFGKNVCRRCSHERGACPPGAQVFCACKQVTQAGMVYCRPCAAKNGGQVPRK